MARWRMADDLTTRLRGDLPEHLVEKHWCADFDATQALMREAATEIERLRSELRWAKSQVEIYQNMNLHAF